MLCQVLEEYNNSSLRQNVLATKMNHSISYH